MTTQGNNPRRHGRLDLRAVGRHVLSRKAVEEEAARIRLARRADHRGQRHLLFRLHARDLRQVGRRDARRFRLLASRATASSPTARCWPRPASRWQKFFAQGLEELGPKLGPIVWQFAPTKKFEPDDFEGFLKLLPEKHAGLTLRHALEVRHASFAVPEFVALAEKHGCAICYAHHHDYPEIRRRHGRLRLCPPAEGRGRRRHRLRAEGARRLGGAGEALGRGRPARRPALCRPVTHAPRRQPRDVFVYIIHEGKIRAPQRRWPSWKDRKAEKKEKGLA